MTVSDDYIRRSMRVNRVSEGEAIENSQIVFGANDKIDRVIRSLDRGDITRVQAELKISAIISKTYGEELVDKTNSDSKLIVENEIKWNFSTISSFTDETVAMSSLEVAAGLAKQQPFQGRTFSNWFKREGAKTTRDITGILRASFVEGLTIDESTKIVEGILGKSSKNIKTLTRSYMLASANIARQNMFDVNSDIIESTSWNSTLDVRTTPHICGVRDQKKYDLDKNPIDHNLPYEEGPGRIHFNCRSIEIPNIEGVTVKSKRPAVGAGENYERGDKTTNRGTVRKPTKANREKGIFEVEQRTNRTKFEGWMRSQPIDFVADSFGSLDRARKFKAGAPLSEVTANPLGTPLRTSQL